MSLYLTMFIAGLLTITLPCILPLVPIVLGVSLAGRNPLRPLMTVIGMVCSFVVFSFLLILFARVFGGASEYIRIATYYALLLFGVGFVTSSRYTLLVAAILGGFFFQKFGWVTVMIAQTIGAFAAEGAGKVAQFMQTLGTKAQTGARNELGEDSLLTAFVIGATMGFVWVPCAGPALGYVFTLIHDEPGLRAFSLLVTYSIGTAVPLLLIGYGGQAATQRVRVFARFSGRIKQIAGVILIVTALSLQYHWFRSIETYIIRHTPYGNIGIDLEMKLFGG